MEVYKDYMDREWVDVNDMLPGFDTDVWACWGPEKGNVAKMTHRMEKVRGEITSRYYWNGILSPWKILFWMPYYTPAPPLKRLKAKIEESE